MADKKRRDVRIENRRAHHEYTISETFEAGLALSGCEVKSIRLGNASLAESFCKFDAGELYIFGMHIAPYEQGNSSNPDPLRQRKLLLHKSQLARLRKSTQEKGFAVVPLKIYFKRTYAKLLIGIGQGKRLWDKRETLARKDAERQMDRALKERHR